MAPSTTFALVGWDLLPHLELIRERVRTAAVIADGLTLCEGAVAHLTLVLACQLNAQLLCDARGPLLWVAFSLVAVQIRSASELFFTHVTVCAVIISGINATLVVLTHRETCGILIIEL